MSLSTVASVMLFYPLLLLGDGCLLIAIAVASTTRGHAILWGASFAFFHAIYGVLGVALVSEVSHYSELLGEAFMLGGAIFLLWHFVHHRIHHRMHTDCSCENHPAATVGSFAVVSSAAALSLHSLAGGAIIRNWLPEASSAEVMWLLTAASCILGAMTAAIVFFGERQQQRVLRVLDSLPGAFGFILSALCFSVLFHLIEGVTQLTSLLVWAFMLVAFGTSCYVGYRVHGKNQAASLVRIGARKQ